SLLPPGTDPNSVTPQSYRVANAKPLSAEQLSRAIPRAAGVLQSLEQPGAAEPSVFVLKEYLSGTRTEPPCTIGDTEALFAGIFGNPPGEPEIEFQPSSAHSLFLLNDRLVQGWLKPRPGCLIERLDRLPDSKAAAEELYLSILTRMPEPDETAEV